MGEPAGIGGEIALKAWLRRGEGVPAFYLIDDPHRLTALAASQIAPEMRKVIEAMPVGQVSQPIVQKNGVGVIMVCGKTAGSTGGLSRDDVAETILRQRFDTLSRRYLRDLRRTAYVDVRA